MKWRKLLSVGNRKEQNRAEKTDPQDARTDDRETGEIPMGKADSESSSDSSYLVLGGVIVLLGILALLFKIWKGKSARHLRQLKAQTLDFIGIFRRFCGIKLD